jgi:hypothetical protein
MKAFGELLLSFTSAMREHIARNHLLECGVAASAFYYIVRPPWTTIISAAAGKGDARSTPVFALMSSKRAENSPRKKRAPQIRERK